MNCFLYIRTSTTDQKLGLEAQQVALRSWCAANGHTVAGEYVEQQSGQDLTGRPQARAAIDAACRSKGALVIFRLDRKGRSVIDLATTAKRILDAGATMISLAESWDLATPAGRFLYTILSGAAAYERDLISARTKAGLEVAKSKGVLLGSARVDAWGTPELNDKRLAGLARARQVLAAKRKAAQ